MMPTAPDDDMSLKEIARTLADFRLEFRSQISQLVRGDVYRAEQAALTQRMTQLEKDHESEVSQRRSTRNLAIGALFSAIGSLIVAFIIAGLR